MSRNAGVVYWIPCRSSTFPPQDSAVSCACHVPRLLIGYLGRAQRRRPSALRARTPRCECRWSDLRQRRAGATDVRMLWRCTDLAGAGCDTGPGHLRGVNFRTVALRSARAFGDVFVSPFGEGTSSRPSRSAKRSSCAALAARNFLSRFARWDSTVLGATPRRVAIS